MLQSFPFPFGWYAVLKKTFIPFLNVVVVVCLRMENRLGISGMCKQAKKEAFQLFFQSFNLLFFLGRGGGGLGVDVIYLVLTVLTRRYFLQSSWHHSYRYVNSFPWYSRGN